MVQRGKKNTCLKRKSQKKAKTLDVDELSVEEIELMIKDHEEQIIILKILLKQKREKLELAKDFFKKT